jgi:hypothetical protein
VEGRRPRLVLVRITVGLSPVRYLFEPVSIRRAQNRGHPAGWGCQNRASAGGVAGAFPVLAPFSNQVRGGYHIDAVAWGRTTELTPNCCLL